MGRKAGAAGLFSFHPTPVLPSPRPDEEGGVDIFIQPIINGADRPRGLLRTRGRAAKASRR